MSSNLFQREKAAPVTTETNTPAPETSPEAPAEHPPVYADAAARRAAALAEVAAYRAANPGDARSDETLLRVPYGGFELADLSPARQLFKPELLRRLASGFRKAPVQPITTP